MTRSEYFRGEGVRGGVWGDRVVVESGGGLAAVESDADVPAVKAMVGKVDEEDAEEIVTPFNP